VTDQLHGRALFRRVVADHRRVIYPLLAILVINIVVFAAGVYPLAQRVANIEQRDREAEVAHANAQREYDAARGALTGKERASVELQTFYKDVLPADLPGARRLTYLRLAQLAREAGLVYKTSSFDRDEARGNTTLQRYRGSIELEGSYENVRAFLYQLDTAPEFVVIDDVSLSQNTTERAALQLSMQLSTYYRLPPS
jgi:Tfp pilus assembly protein PilO